MAKLKILSGDNAGKEFAIEHLMLNIGRDPSNDVVLDESGVSRRHAQIRKEGDRYEVIDQGSSNGTMVNERKVSSSELKDGDSIRLGEVVLGFCAEAEAAAEAAPEVMKPAAPAEKIKANATFVRFGLASSDQMQRLSGLQDKFGSFLMGKAVSLNQTLNFKGVSLKVIEIRPSTGGIIGSETEVDVALAEGKFAGAEKKAAPKQAAAVGELEKANPFKRLLAYLVDVVVMVFLMIASGIVTRLLGPIGLILYLAIPAYFLLRDGISPGQSPGKKILRIMVVNVGTKQAIGKLGSLKRQIFMMIPILNLIECILILTDPEGRRIGDKVANTMVVNA